MKVKKVRQIATPNIRLRLSGTKYLLLSFCFVSSLHQTLPSHFEVWYSFAKKWFRPNWGFPHKSSWCAQSYFAHTGRFMKGWVLPSFLCQEQKCAKKKSCSPEKLVKLPSCQFSHEKLVKSPCCQFSHEKLIKSPSCQFSHEKLVKSPSCQFRDRS